MILQVQSPKYGLVEFQLDELDWLELQQCSFYAWGSKRHHGLYLLAYYPDDFKTAHRVHRLIMKAKPGQLVDHIDRDTTNNLRENLRITTHSVNNQNARKRKDGVTSKYKGVSWDTRINKWKVQIQVNKKKISLGQFDSETYAATAYNHALDNFGIEGPRNKV